MVSVRFGSTEASLCPFHDFDRSRRGKHRTDVDGHVEQTETGVTFVSISRVVVQVADHHLQVSFEETGTDGDQQQRTTHCDDSATVSAQGQGEEQVTEEHDCDPDGYHFAVAQFVSGDTAEQRHEVNKT